MPAGGGTPVDLAKLNGTGTLDQLVAALRPTVQHYKGNTIAWVTFSSTRDYGDVVRNSTMVNGHAAAHLLSAGVAGEHVDEQERHRPIRTACSRSCGWRRST